MSDQARQNHKWRGVSRTVRAKLLAGFVIVLALNFAVGLIAWRGFDNVDQALSTLRNQSLPNIALAMDLANKSSALAALAPFVGSVQVMNKLDAESKNLVQQLEAFRKTVDIERSQSGYVFDQSLRTVAGQLDSALRDLIETTHENLSVRSDVLELRYDFEQRDSLEMALRGAARRGATGESSVAELAVFDIFQRLVDLVFEAMVSEDRLGMARQQQDFEVLARRLEPYRNSVPGLSPFLVRHAKVFDLRQRELDTLQRTRYLLASIHAYSTQLSEKVATIVGSTVVAAGHSGEETSATLAASKQRILLLSALGVLLAALTATYVVSNLAVHLQGVTNAMSRLAKGNRDVSVPGLQRIDEIGELARAFNVFKDQSFERENLARQLAANADLNEAIFSNLTDGLTVFDDDYRLVTWNPRFSELVRLREELVKGAPLSGILSDLVKRGMEVRRLSGEVVDQVELLATRQRTAMEYELHFKDGRVLSLRSRPMANVGFVTIYSDLTDRRSIERQLRQSQRMEALGQLTGGIAHDFNNLLAAASGNLQLLQESGTRDEKINVRILRALDAVERATAVTHRLLAFSRQQALLPENIELDVLLAGLVDLIGYSLGNTIDLRIDLNASGAVVAVDPGQLENAVLNLAFNSRDAMPDGGVLTIASYLDRTGEENSDVVLTVVDTGMGMDEEVSLRAPEPFFTTKGIGHGTGLGLSMVYGFVQQSGGRIGILSALGEGTKVEIRLPLAVSRFRREKSQRTVNTAESGQGHVLLVEDDSLVRATTIDMLETLGYKTSAVGNAPEAMTALDSSDFDLLITDVMLPDGHTGLDVIEHAHRRRPTLKTVFVSGFAVDAIRKRVPLEHNATILQKPFRIEALAKALREQLESA